MTPSDWRITVDKGKELAKNTIILTIGKICTQFLTFLLMPLYTAVLSTEEYGTVDAILTYVSLLLPLVFLQMDQALFRFLIDARKDKVQSKSIFTTTIVFTVMQMLIATVIFGVVQFFISSSVKWYLLLNLFASILSSMMLQTARGFGNNTTYAMGSLLSASTQIGCNILFLVVFKFGMAGMLLATALGQLLAAAFVFLKMRLHRYLDKTAFTTGELKRLVKYSAPLVPNALCWWAINASDRLIVVNFLGAAANGLLAVGHKFSSIYITVYNIFNLSWTESAALHMHDEDRDEFFTDVITNMFKLFMCAGIGLIAIMPFLFPIFVDESFHEAYGLIPLFVLASMMNVVIGLYSVIYVALRRTDMIAKTSLYSGIISIVTHLSLLPFIGLYAAPTASTVAFGTMAVYRYFDMKKYVNVPLKLKWIILFAVMYCVATWSYFCGNVYIQAGVLAVIAVVALALNWGTIKQYLDVLLKKVKR